MKKESQSLNLFDLSEMFATEDQTVAWYERYQGDKAVYPHCDSEMIVTSNSQGKYYYCCAVCSERFTVKSIRLRKAAMSLFTNGSNRYI